MSLLKLDRPSWGDVLTSLTVIVGVVIWFAVGHAQIERNRQDIAELKTVTAKIADNQTSVALTLAKMESWVAGHEKWSEESQASLRREIEHKQNRP